MVKLDILKKNIKPDIFNKLKSKKNLTRIFSLIDFTSSFLFIDFIQSFKDKIIAAKTVISIRIFANGKNFINNTLNEIND